MIRVASPAARIFLFHFSGFLIAALMVIGAAGELAAAAARPQSLPVTPLVIETADGGEHRFKVEVALTSGQRATGLMFRKEMPEDHGMIFYFFKTRIVRMWMKNTYLSLDMIFIRADGTIVSVAHSAVPESLVTVASEGLAVSALELNGGTAKRLGIKAGDLVRHKVFGNLD